MSDEVPIQSASEMSESANLGEPAAGNRINIGAEGGDAPINTVANGVDTAPAVGAAVTTISAPEEGDVPLQSASASD